MNLEMTCKAELILKLLLEGYLKFLLAWYGQIPEEQSEFLMFTVHIFCYNWMTSV